MTRIRVKNLKKTTDESQKKSEPSSYEDNFVIQKLKMLCIIVNRHQGDYFIDRLMDNKVGAAYLVYGTGTATREIYDLLGVGDTKKDIVLSLVKESDVPEIKKMISDRFSVSKKAKGIAFFADVNSIAGVLMYKYFTNTRENIRREGK